MGYLGKAARRGGVIGRAKPASDRIAVEPGGLRNTKGHLSLWRVPNFLFEARGKYLGETDETIDRLARWRAVIGLVLIIAITLRFQGTKVFGYSYLPKHAPNIHLELPFESAEIITIAISTGITVVVAFLVAASLVIWARPGARRATIVQLRWPVLTMLVFGAFMTLMVVLFVKVIPAAEGRFGYWKSPLQYLWLLIIALAWIALAVCLLKSLYLVITGLFRADDGHPLLAPIAYPIAVIGLAGWTMLHSGQERIPAPIWALSLWLGPLTSLLLSAWAVMRMRKKHAAFPFRDGPL